MEPNIVEIHVFFSLQIEFEKNPAIMVRREGFYRSRTLSSSGLLVTTSNGEMKKNHVFCYDHLFFSMRQVNCVGDNIAIDKIVDFKN